MINHIALHKVYKSSPHNSHFLSLHTLPKQESLDQSHNQPTVLLKLQGGPLALCFMQMSVSLNEGLCKRI